MKSSTGGGYRKKKFMGFHLALIFSEPGVKKIQYGSREKHLQFCYFLPEQKIDARKAKRLLKEGLINFKKQ